MTAGCVRRTMRLELVVQRHSALLLPRESEIRSHRQELPSCPPASGPADPDPMAAGTGESPGLVDYVMLKPEEGSGSTPADLLSLGLNFPVVEHCIAFTSTERLDHLFPAIGTFCVRARIAAMPPRLNITINSSGGSSACRALAARTRPRWCRGRQQAPAPAPRTLPLLQPRIAVVGGQLARRWYSSDDTMRRPPQREQQPAEPPEMDVDALTKALLQAGQPLAEEPKTGREDGEAEQQLQDADGDDAGNNEALRQLDMMALGLNPFDVTVDGHKFGIPETPWQEHMHLKDRYSPVLAQLTRLIMRHGKLSKAQRVFPPPFQARMMRSSVY